MTTSRQPEASNKSADRKQRRKYEPSTDSREEIRETVTVQQKLFLQNLSEMRMYHRISDPSTLMHRFTSHLSADFRTKVEAASSLHNDTTTFVLTGFRKDVERALAEITRLNQPSHNTHRSYSDAKPRFSGDTDKFATFKAESRFARLAASELLRSGARIEMKSHGDSLILRGQSSLVDDALNKLPDIINNLRINCRNQVSIHARPEVCKYLEELRFNQIMIKTLVSLENTGNSILISGEDARIVEAVETLLDKMSNIKSISFEITPIQRLFLQKKFAKTIANMSQEKCVMISCEDDVLVVGASETIADVCEKIKHLVSSVTHFAALEISPKDCKTLESMGGRTISAIEEKFAVSVLMCTEKTHVGSTCGNIFMSGLTKDSVEDAKSAFQAALQRLYDVVSEVLKLDPSVYSRIIGHQGSTIDRIRREFPTVTLDIPRISDNVTGVRIEGCREEVEAVKDRIRGQLVFGQDKYITVMFPERMLPLVRKYLPMIETEYGVDTAIGLVGALFRIRRDGKGNVHDSADIMREFVADSDNIVEETVDVSDDIYNKNALKESIRRLRETYPLLICAPNAEGKILIVGPSERARTAVSEMRGMIDWNLAPPTTELVTMQEVMFPPVADLPGFVKSRLQWISTSFKVRVEVFGLEGRLVLSGMPSNLHSAIVEAEELVQKMSGADGAGAKNASPVGSSCVSFGERPKLTVPIRQGGNENSVRNQAFGQDDARQGGSRRMTDASK